MIKCKKELSVKFKNHILLVISLACLPLYAHAFDFTPDPSRVVSDPTYLPLQGQVYGDTNYQFRQLKDDENNHLGTQTHSLTQNEQLISQSLAYGVLDDFTIRVSDSYLPTIDNKYDYSSGASEDYHFQGFEDPAFGATWRALDQRAYPLNVDITGSYMPDWITNKEATRNSTGTVARGGDEGSLALALSYETRSFTIEGVGGSSYYGNEKSGASAPFTDATTSHYWGYFGGLQTQTRITDAFSFNAGYRYTTYDNQSSVNTVRTSYSTSVGDQNEFNAALNYQIIPNRLVAGLAYSYFLYGDSHNHYANADSDTTIRNENGNLFGVRLQYVFF